MQDAIILYENGKAIGGEGHPTDADDITFNNTDTDIAANKVGSAIKEINEKTKHGVVELWKNSNISATFAGQSVTVNNYDKTKYDGIVIAYEPASGERQGAIWLEVDTEAFENTSFTASLESMTLVVAQSKVQRSLREVTISLSGTTLTLAFGDAKYYTQNAIGTASTEGTLNTIVIPVRILGLIHND